MQSFTISLSHDDALVLFEWMASLEEKGAAGLTDEAEQVVIWRVEAQLEASLPDIVMNDYEARVSAAKRRVTHSPGS